MQKQWKKTALRIALWAMAAGAAVYAALIGLVCYWEENVPEARDYDSIIVLGAQVLPTGEASVQLRWRLDKAKEVYEKHPCYIVVCGAQGGNEPAPEGDVMRSLLIEEGLPPEHVIAETQSVNTKENIRNAWDILQNLGCEEPVIVTSDYHLPRAMAIARDAGLDPQGEGSLCRSGLKYWAKNHLREALAWVKYWGIKYLHLPL